MGDFVARVLRRQWLWMVLFFVLTSGIVALVTFLTPKSYGSEAKLLVRLGRENATLDPTTTLGREPVVAVPASRENDLGSIIEIIRSKIQLEEVVTMVGVPAILGLGAPNPVVPGEVQLPKTRSTEFDLAVRTLAKNLTVDLIKKTNIVQITFEGPSPETAQAVVAALLERTTERNIHLHRNPRAYSFVEEQTKRLRNELTTQEKKLAELKSETRLFSAEAERQAAVTRVARLRDELLQTGATLASVEKEVRLAREQLQEVPANQTTAKTTGAIGLGNDTLKNQLIALQTKEQEVRTRYSANHPEAKLLKQQLDTLREQLAQDEKQNPREQIVVGPNRLYEDLRLTFLRAQTQHAGLVARHELLTEQLNRELTALAQLDANALRLAQQQREVDLLTTNYRKYAESLEQSQLDRTLESEKISNLSVAQPATFDPIAVRPRLTVNLGVGLALGLVGAIALGWLLESMRSQPSLSPQSSQNPQKE